MSTVKCFEKIQVSVMAVVYILMSLHIDDHQVVLEEDREKLNQCYNHWELFGYLNLYWNYLSYSLLDHFIKDVSLRYQYLTDVEGKIAEQSLADIREQMSLYKGDLDQFRKNTPLILFCQAEKWRVRVEGRRSSTRI